MKGVRKRNKCSRTAGGEGVNALFCKKNRKKTVLRSDLEKLLK
jgi:hypothetical protein